MTTEPETSITPELETNIVPTKKPGRAKITLVAVVTWTVLASLWVADGVIWLMLRTRPNERRIRPTKRPVWPKGLKRELMRQQNNTCVYCGSRRTAGSLQIDHIVPVVMGGSNDESNLQVICAPCNQRKGIQNDQEFRNRYSRLIPQRPLTPPRRRISQDEFSTVTQGTTQSERVRNFRRTKFISRREKVGGACFGLAIVLALVMYLLLSSWGIEDLLALLPPMALGAAVGIGIWARAHVTGVMVEDQ